MATGLGADVSTVERLSGVGLDKWEHLYGRAVASGCGWLVAPEEERIAPAYELVAQTVAALCRLGAFAMVVDAVRGAEPQCAAALARESAAALRTLDRALAAHGRDHGYDVTAWLERAVRAACATAGELLTMPADEWPLSWALEQAAAYMAVAVVDLHEQLMGVPEALAEAMGCLLAVHAASPAMRTRGVLSSAGQAAASAPRFVFRPERSGGRRGPLASGPVATVGIHWP
jgi:hypothetical protein